MKINLNLIKEGIKYVKATIISAVPILFVGKYYLDAKKYQDAIATIRINELNGYPTTLAEYKDWITTAPPEEVEKYNAVLAYIKSKGDVSAELLQETGMDNSTDFHSHLKLLFEQGKAGDALAQEQFNALYQSYQDDMFYQTAVGIDEPLPEVIVPNDVITPPDTGGSGNDWLSTNNLLIIAAIGIVGIGIVGYGLHKHFKNKQKNKSNIFAKEK